MISLAFMRELYSHMEWADAKIWQSVLTAPEAASDVALQKRLFHIHFTQYAFLQAWKFNEFKNLRFDGFPGIDELYAWMRPYYGDLEAYLNALDDDALDAPMPLPWAKYYGRQIGRKVEITTLGETLFQVAGHSIHHRAQINIQLRDHGVEPPLIDYIAWVWAGRPAPDWLQKSAEG